MKKRKKIIVILIIVILLGVGIYLYINYEHKKNDITFTLNGLVDVIIDYGSKYSEPGFIAHDGFNHDLSSKVEVKGSVNTLMPSTYMIEYSLNYLGKVYNLNRKVTVNEIKIDDLELVINGEKEIYLLKDSNYQEEGAYVLDKVINEKYSIDNIEINHNININNTGEYEVIYSYNYKNDVITTTRKVIVFDIPYEITPKELTPNNIKINLDLENVIDYANILLPNGEKSSDKKIEYEVNSNGTYNFVIESSNGKTYTKKVLVDNIIGTYNCTGKITNTGTKIEISPKSEEISEYEWTINGNVIKGNNVFTKDKIIKNATVNLIFKNRGNYQVKCSIEDKLVYHFKYDENNKKEKIKCDSYTAADRTKLEGMLKQVIEEAGYGTRAGVVEAARFIVGALDYKIEYLGPKKVNEELGRYPKAGLNIGNSKAWGCRVSGYIQGMDCTNFISWVFAQNGITTRPYSGNRTKVKDALDKIKVGDLLYVSCSTCASGLLHVGIIIGIDDTYFYVAESEPAKGGIVVNKYTKNDLYIKTAFTLVNLKDYGSDGNLTNMWMSE